MKRKALSAAALAAFFLLTLSACGKPAAAAEPTSTSSVQQTKEPWKVDFEKSLWANYGAVPEYYEDLGDGIYQVYVEKDGRLVPFVTVDSATGDYHG